MFTKPMQLNETYSKLRGIPESREKDMFGIEIELEGKNILNAHLVREFIKYWGAVEDGSLRKNKPGDQAIEYRFNGPLSLSDTEEALTILETLLTKSDVTVYDSGRTSVHVHVNCLSDSMATVYNFITLAIIFDELLVSQNGHNRIGNNFCLRARDAEGLIISLAEGVKNYGGLSIDSNYRYSSTNLASLNKFGTIEFRSMECTTNKARLMNWIKTLQALKNAARTYTNPAEIMGQFSLLGPERFFLNTLGVQAIRYMHVADRHRMLFDGLRLVQEFANAATWEPAKEVEKKVNRIKKGAPEGDPWQAYVAAQAAHAQAAGLNQVVQAAMQPIPPHVWNFVQPAQPAQPHDYLEGVEDTLMTDVFFEDEDEDEEFI